MGEHTCDMCGTHGSWGRGWRYFGSINDAEEGAGDTTIVVVCSDQCANELDAIGSKRFLEEKRVFNGFGRKARRYPR